MTSDEFNAVLNRRKAEMTDVLASKADEYATADRLHNFKAAALLLRSSPESALLGMLAKHLVSVIDMVQSDRAYTRRQWDEKIGDAVNYLMLLEGLVIDQGRVA